MTAARLALLASACLAPAFAGYTYDYPNLLNPYNSSNWSLTGSPSPSNNFYTSSTSNGSSVLFGPGLPSPSNSYEVRTTLTLTASGGHYITYLRASSGSLLAGNTGTFYAVEVANPTFSGSTCSATLNIYKDTGHGGSPVSSSGIGCSNGMIIRAVVLNFNVVAVYINNLFWTSWGWGDNTPITTGQPGVGVSGAPSGNGISAIDIGHQDTVAPNPLNAQLVGTSSFSNRVDIQFPGDVDDPNGTGIAYYQFFRCAGANCSYDWIAMTTEPEFSDTTVQPGSTYTYEVQAVDYHYNGATVYVTVTTPPTGSIDPREVGVRPLGSYWGGAGEQLDMRSGNLSYSVPLLKAMGRGGWGVGFNLSYNSQNWRQDPGGTWQLGRDIGYGYGWKMQAGSLTPVYYGYLYLDHYLFIDSTGAEYRLTVNTNGVWSSKEGIYVYYDSNAGKLHFRDGSFWTMGALSAGTEQDAGTLYPTQIEDSNGNQITLVYNDGDGVTWNNSSSRISTITDVRTGPSQATYTFTYNTDAIPHLTSISNHIQTSENYTFGYISNYTLTTPFGGGTGFGTFSMLQCANSVTIPGSTTFAYDGAGTQSCSNYSGGSGAGELTKMNTPAGGNLGWSYGTATYVGTRLQREVQTRNLLMASGGTELTYHINHSSDPNSSVHSYCLLDDADGVAGKWWSFQTSTSPASSLGLATFHLDYPNVNVGSNQHSEAYTWTTDSAGNPYISEIVTQEAYNTSNAILKVTTQTLDQYGNVTQMQLYNYGPPGTGQGGSLARTYTNTYLTNNSNYTSRYIFNRLSTSTVTDGTHTTTLASNTYDGSGYTDVPGITMHDANYNTSFPYRGNVSQSVTPSGTKTVYYDIGGNVTRTTNNGVTTSVATNSTTNWAAPSQLTTNSLSSSMNWAPFLGLSSATGPNGDTASLNYGGSERPTSSTSPTGAVTNYTYVDGIGPSVTATTNGHWVKTIKDGFGRTIETDTGYSTTTLSIVKTGYAPCGCSPLGKVSQVSQPYKPTDSPVYTTYNYDGMGRTTSVVAPDGSTTSYSYSGNNVTVTDPAGKWKTFTMDAMGNLTQVQEPDPSLGTVTTTYTYDILSHLIGVSMPRGSTTQTRTFNYTSGNSVGALLLSATNPENGTVSYTYDTYKRLATKTDAKGQVFNYTYDLYNRLTQMSVGSTTLRTYVYDTNSDDSNYSQYPAGRLVEIKYPAVGYSVDTSGTPGSTMFTDMFSYTQAGQVAGKRLRVTQTMRQTNPNTHQQFTQTAQGDLNLAYTYNNEGKVTQVTYPTDNNSTTPTFSYTYDSMMRLSNMTDGSNYSQPVVNGVTYNAANQLTAVNYYDAAETRAYNSLMQLTNITTSDPYLPSTKINITYNYTGGSNNGKIGSATDAISGETVTYQYDSLNRLISASGSGWTQTQAYDPFGNLTGRTGTGTAQGTTISTPTNASTNRLSGYSYDANGNLISTGYTYDVENRMSYAASGAAQYFYDAQNKRVWQASCTTSGYCNPGSGWVLNLNQDTVNLFGADGKQLASYQATGAWNPSGGTNVTMGFIYTNTRVYFGGKLVGQQAYTNGYQPVIQDRLGSVGKYYPYGEERNSPQLPNDQVKFATYTRDSATGNDYADQRYYTSTLGRFVTPDQLPGQTKNPQSWNRYSYANADPANFNDPTGLTAGGWPMYAPADPDIGAGGGCDPSDASCNNPCVGADGFTPTPSPFCQTGGPPPVETPAPSTPQPQCSVSLYERPVIVNGITVAEHTYVDLTITQSNGTSFNWLCEGGPSNPNGSGTLQGGCVFAANGTATKGTSGPGLPGNVQVGQTYTGANACDDVSEILGAVTAYTQNGVFAPYRPIIGSRSPYGYNSNSYAFTLLYDVGLAWYFPNKNPYSWFGSPPNTPGWGRLVPGL
ncbi:MAG TPA: RHS repeat-associated core domain-containing protein [Bryobacteraceae bacterium]|nr:RHS repeat-associated core domain-containing protein [Bryobacteraceae bacterium]